MKIKQKDHGRFARKKYSEIKDNECYVNAKSAHNRADWAVGMLMANGYTIMDGYAINEILKTIRTLKELGVEYTMKTVESQQVFNNRDAKWKDMYYEFTTIFFEDDRE